ncbi:HAD-IIIA family hydrolase [Candidatus Woesearchaeota archaeon]|nr:HAD-IIIA family hydrolase [Candidatus Woesearchaeota archaeon]
MDKAVIMDRDGTINHDTGYAHKIEDFKLVDGAIEALNMLKDDFKFFIVTNQSGIGREIFTFEDFKKFNNHLIKTLKESNIRIEKTYTCPHHPDENCDCRKPSVKFIKEAEKEFNLDLKNSWVIGDQPHDIEMGKRAGCKTIYVLTGYGKKRENELNGNSKPDFIAENIYEASKIIINQ